MSPTEDRNSYHEGTEMLGVFLVEGNVHRGETQVSDGRKELVLGGRLRPGTSQELETLTNHVACAVPCQLLYALGYVHDGLGRDRGVEDEGVGEEGVDMVAQVFVREDKRGI